MEESAARADEEAALRRKAEDGARAADEARRRAENDLRTARDQAHNDLLRADEAAALAAENARVAREAVERLAAADARAASEAALRQAADTDRDRAEAGRALAEADARAERDRAEAALRRAESEKQRADAAVQRASEVLTTAEIAAKKLDETRAAEQVLNDRARRARWAEVALIRAERERDAGRHPQALAHAISSIRVDPNAGGAGLAFQERVAGPRLVWTSPKGDPKDAKAPGHTGAITALAFSADGSRIFSASRDKTVRLWDTTTGECLRTVDGGKSPVTSLAVSQDGKHLAIAREDGYITIHAAEGFTWVWGFKVTAGKPGIAFDEDGRVLLVFGWGQKGVRRFDVASAAELDALVRDGGQITAVATGPDGRRVIASADKLRAVVRNASPREIPLEPARGGATCAAIDGAGTVVAVGRGDGAIEAVRLGSWHRYLMVTRATSNTGMTGVAVARDGQFVAGKESDTALCVWGDIQGHRPREAACIAGFGRVTDALAFSPAVPILATGWEDGSIRLWDLAERRVSYTGKWERNVLRLAVCRPDGRQLAANWGAQTVVLADAATGQQTREMEGHKSGPLVLTYCADGSLLATGSSDWTARLWDPERGTILHVLEGHVGPVTALEFSRDGALLVTASQGEPTLRLWNTKSGEKLATLASDGGKRGSTRAVALDPGGARLAAAVNDRVIRLWSVTEKKTVATIKNLHAAVETLLFNRNGSALAAGCGDGAIAFPALVDGPGKGPFKAHAAAVRRMAWSPDGSRLASRSTDARGDVILMDAATGEIVRHLDPEDGAALIDAWSLPGAALDLTSRFGSTTPRWPVDAGAWRAAWWGAECDAQGVPKAVLALLNQWERQIGMRADPQTGEITLLPAPGTYYADRPYVAPRCQ
ncbi:MAG: hypothetical protein HY719_09225 [Planctomycetes bacterium]|nr:hypothetical protein [Planctomycetota bacterium]